MSAQIGPCTENRTFRSVDDRVILRPKPRKGIENHRRLGAFVFHECLPQEGRLGGLAGGESLTGKDSSRPSIAHKAGQNVEPMDRKIVENDMLNLGSNERQDERRVHRR